LNRFIRYNETKDYATIKKAIDFQNDFLKTIPDQEYLEKPLLLQNIYMYSDSIDISNIVNTVAIPYLKKVAYTKPSTNAFINNSINSITKKQHRQIDYIIWNYGEERGWSSKNGYIGHYPAYLKKTMKDLLNSTAWYMYSMYDSSSTALAIDFVQAALQIDKTNPFALDTYAHLLYKKGDKKAAITVQEKAIAEAIKQSNEQEMTEEQVQLFKNELEKIKNDTL
jgi:hypothetical protein